MLTLIGLLTIAALVTLLITGRTTAIIALVLVPLVAALIVGTGTDALAGYFNDGLKRVAPIAAMFMFAITFFGVLQDAGLFRPLVDGLVRMTAGNIVAVAVMTALLGMVAHLDGAGATTFLLTVPALLPLYRRLHMSPYLMLLLLATGAGIFNMLPWAGPLGRAAAVTGIDVGVLWRPLLPVQVIGAVLLLAMAALLGLRERGRAARLAARGGDLAPAESAALLPRMAAPVPVRHAWLNALLFVAVLGALVGSLLPSAYIFMIGLALALLINYRRPSQQMEAIAAHAPAALKMGAIILAAGSFLGVMDGSGMLRSIAADLAHVLPDPMLPWLHVLLGMVGLPMELLLSTDAYYFGLLPVVLEITTPLGVDPAHSVYALTIGNIVGTFISPFSPALWLALGLAGADIGRHIRYSLGWMWGFSLLLLGAAWLLGLF
ncbi:citrate:proton symporter [Stenotrophomonas sp.]|jgi:CitMHS family citrate-Mg2+:H+ or citrate-Ca2+:H+ symporter|uniref:CitMHS family transporter n=1 Tax=Stenotrophomonas TaxID=40323 RepID=UPI0025F61A4B|nr:citrate:proton symporter [Stenotrophomonas sp.]MBW8373446.1 citrate:proton symporter [Stenotrophomonas sp.]